MKPQPQLIVFDVNETLSDMSPMSARFVDVGAPGLLARVWFAALLRDGFALAAAGGSATFASIGAEVVRETLRGVQLTREVDDAVDHIMTGLGQLKLHPDVPEGVRALGRAGLRMVTLTNGSTQLAEAMFGAAGIRDEFEALYTVEDAPAWKPARSAYRFAADACGVELDRMLLVACHPWDIHGAAGAGMHTAWLNRGDAAYPAHFSAPDHVISALTELPEQLRH